MQRKLVKQGAATLMVSLPSKWIQKNGLDKGDEVDVSEKEYGLMITARPLKEEIAKATIDVTGMSPLINRSLLALYVRGVDEIEVNFEDKREINVFQKKVSSELLGFEIIRQTNKNFILKDVTGCEKQEVDEIIKRIFLILDSMAEELVDCVKNRQPLDPVIDADSAVNRLTNFCLRILNKKGYTESKKTSQIYGILNLLEETGDCYKYIAREIVHNKVKPLQLQVIEQSRILLKNFNSLLQNFDKQMLVENARFYESIRKKIEGKNILDFYLHQLNDTIIRINNYLLVFALTE